MDNPNGYETFEWSGVTKYRCPYCPFDADTPMRVKTHVYERHVETLLRIQEEQRAMTAELYDADNKRITSKPADPVLDEMLERLKKGEPI